MTQDEYRILGRNIMRKAGVKRFIPIRIARNSRSATRGYDIVWARPSTDDTTLALMAHEAGHVATSDTFQEQGYRLVSIELAASLWAEQALTEMGVTITDEMRRVWRYGLASYMMHPSAVDDLRADGTGYHVRKYLQGYTADDLVRDQQELSK